MSVIIFILILAFLVFIHELGHFLVAKWCGIRVDEFAIGFPPKIYSFKKGETTYSINAIPFGGYVKIFGENPDDESIKGSDSKRSFVNKPKWMQVAVLSAGVLFNILSAWVLLSIALASGMTTSVEGIQDQYVSNKRVMIQSVAKDSGAEKAGLKAGDQVLAFSSRAIATTSAESVESIQNVIKNSNGAPIVFEIKTATTSRYISAVAEKKIEGGVYALGIAIDTVGDVHLPWYKAPFEAVEFVRVMFVNITKGLYSLIGHIFTGTADFSQISGPVGIAGVVGEARELGIMYLVSFTALISVNLAALNLIPFPALDGGRILFVIIEAIIRRPIKPSVANTVNAIGFGLLLLLMVVVTVKDVLKLF